ncbi:MAG: adenylate/guanylate cyclase domain-containing protein, partial [Bacteroidales bacterium]|nr:adenylate/guanylate cyclase domain-containing protein [Bacteroidales bacterium]
VEGLKNYEKWSGWSSHGHVELSSVPAGKYKLKVRARNILGQISEENILNFEVLKPFWQKREFHIAVIVLFLVLVGLVFYWSNRALIKKKNILEQKVRERTQELQLQKDKTEELLLNILPKETAEELKLNNKVKPRDYDNVTVMFTDFKGFTKIAEELTPAELVDEIDYCFKAFDKIISKYKIEKIKTIGDSYMCAGGLPTKFKNNAIHIVKAALEMRDFIKHYEEERKKQNLFFFQIRLGIHTGKVVAGVVGTKKYAYDIWGDTVNVASRMESSGEPGKINISGDTYELIKEKFDCSYRGKVNAKSLGEVEMYFVDDVARNGSNGASKSTGRAKKK